MRKLLVVPIALLLIAGIGSMASAQFVSTLTSTTTPQILELTCTAVPISPTSNSFLYFLHNPIINTDAIGGFTLEFPNVSTSDFVVTSTPVGWVSGIVGPSNKINWKWTDFANPDEQLDPGETFEFSFTSALGFGGPTSANASAQDGHGYSGQTCGPVPEPASVMMSLLGLCSIPGIRRLRRK